MDNRNAVLVDGVTWKPKCEIEFSADEALLIAGSLADRFTEMEFGAGVLKRTDKYDDLRNAAAERIEELLQLWVGDCNTDPLDPMLLQHAREAFDAALLEKRRGESL